MLMLTGCGASGAPGSRIFVADEAGGTVSVLDHASMTRIATIDLTDTRSGVATPYQPHNVQASPDGRTVWVVAPPVASGTDPHGHGGGPSEQVVVIDPTTLTIAARIDVGTGLHVAHVVLDGASRYAYVTANEASAVLRIDAQTYAVVGRYELGAGRGPHGMRFCGAELYVANMDGHSLSIIAPETGEIREVPLGGVAVQTACVPGGRYVFASLYDSREVVRYDTTDGTLTRIALPEGSEGPVQLYPAPDGLTLYICDQGLLLDRPASNRLYEVDVQSAAVTATIFVGDGAHGVVVSEDGLTAYVTNIAAHSVSIVDTATRTVISTVQVGERPNGIAHWHVSGGMP
jgi:YVTN family beta-propeller protein